MTEAPTSGKGRDVEGLEVKLLLGAVYEHYGYDFRDYAAASMRRRVRGRIEPEGVRTITGLTEKVLHDPECLERLLQALTIHVTSMFRDPGFYRAFREKVAPLLRTYPFPRLWHAGCSSGEEVYSMAILLSEEGLLTRCRLYATDLSDEVLRRARVGIYPLAAMQEYTRNYIQAGGRTSFSDYYTAEHDHAIIRPRLRDQVVFAQHNLVTDASFNEFNAIMCRNVTIYFNRSLQERVHRLFYDSLALVGILALGQGESLKFTPHEGDYEVLDARERIFKKVR